MATLGEPVQLTRLGNPDNLGGVEQNQSSTVVTITTNKKHITVYDAHVLKQSILVKAFAAQVRVSAKSKRVLWKKRLSRVEVKVSTRKVKLETAGEVIDSAMVVDAVPTKVTTLAKGPFRPDAVRDARPQRSWSAEFGETLTCAAVVNFINNDYVAVFNEKKIRTWSEGATSLHKSTKIIAPKTIHQLISVQGEGPLVLYKDGTLAWLTSVSKTIGETVVKDSETIDVCQAVYAEKKVWLVIIVRNKDRQAKTEAQAFVYSLNKDSEVVQPKCIDITDLYVSKEKISIQIGMSATTPSLLILGKSGDLTEVGLGDPNVGQRIKLQPLPSATAKSAIQSVGPKHLAVMDVVAKNTNNVGLSLWDAKFGIPCDWKELPELAKEAQQLKLFCSGGHLVLHCDSVLYAIPYQVKHATLMGALGQLSTKVGDTNLIPESSGKLCSLLADLQDTNKTKSIASFKSMFGEFRKEVEKHDDDEIQYVLHMVGAVVLRCISGSEVWAHEELRFFIKKNMVPSNLTTAMVHTLCLRKHLSLLVDCLQNLQDIPEAALTECLACFLKTDDIDFEKVVCPEMTITDEQKEESCVPCPFSKQKAAVVCCALALPYNEIFLVDGLKKLEFSSAVNLLRYLHHLLSGVSVISARKEKEKNGTSTELSALKVVEWCCLLLDAHFAQMVLATDTRHVLADLFEDIQKQVLFWDELAGLEAILSQIKEKCALPKKQNQGVYNIHVLHVR